MTRRNFTIPSLQALSLSLTAAACSPGILGDWQAVEIDGEPTSYTYSYGPGCTVTYGTVLTLEVGDPDGKSYGGELTYGYFYDYRGCSAYGYADGRNSETYQVDIEVDTEDRKVFEIDIDDLDLRLTCDLEEDELDCEDEDGIDLLFERD